MTNFVSTVQQVCPVLLQMFEHPDMQLSQGGHLTLCRSSRTHHK